MSFLDLKPMSTEAALTGSDLGKANCPGSNVWSAVVSSFLGSDNSDAASPPRAEHRGEEAVEIRTTTHLADDKAPTGDAGLNVVDEIVLELLHHDHS
jgi:hypothetical protein